MKVALQTKLDLSIGRSLDIPSKFSNVTYTLTELMNRGVDELYILNSEDVYPDFSMVSKLDKKTDVYGDYRDLFFSSFKKINLEDLDSIIIRGDDIEENENIEDIYSKLNDVYMPINISEMRLTKDKLDTAKRLIDLDIPRTLYAEDKNTLFNHLFDLFDTGDRYVVLKYRFGFGGNEILRVDKEKNYLDDSLDFLNKYKKVIIQEYDDSVKYGDVRAIVFNGKFVCSYDRRSSGSHWASNISLGGRAYKRKASLKEKKICEEVASKFPNINYMGIDLFPSLKLIEVNGFCGGMSTVQNLYGIDMAKKVVDDVYERVGK